LAQSVNRTRELYATISQVENFIEVHNRLHSNFNLQTALREITSEAHKVTGAQRSIVFLLQGHPPALHGGFMLRGKAVKVVIPVDDTTAVGHAAAHRKVINLKDIDENAGRRYDPVFNRSFDKQCNCVTQSLLMVPIEDSARKVIGVITAVNSKKGYFSADDEWFMSNYATEVALVVEKEKFLQQSLSALQMASIGETIAGLSHCIKNIAQALRGSSYIIRRAIDSNNLRDIKTAWEILDRHIEGLANLSLDVLSYEPLTQKQSKGVMLNEMVRHVVELFQAEARARAIKLNVELGEHADTSSFDPRGIYRCLVNLLTNALDACPLCDGKITVSTRRTGEREHMISVSDNGRGMSDRTKEELFEPFKTTKPGIGSGLGLPTVFDIVKRHNGRIEIMSKRETGTTIDLYIQELSRT
jgi:signal transduction histidine kinase